MKNFDIFESRIVRRNLKLILSELNPNDLEETLEKVIKEIRFWMEYAEDEQ
jgi:lauroyl/myristoyl acyltransferase